jgi:hypothetical protein
VYNYFVWEQPFSHSWEFGFDVSTQYIVHKKSLSNSFHKKAKLIYFGKHFDLLSIFYVWLTQCSQVMNKTWEFGFDVSIQYIVHKKSLSNSFHKKAKLNFFGKHFDLLNIFYIWPTQCIEVMDRILFYLDDLETTLVFCFWQNERWLFS